MIRRLNPLVIRNCFQYLESDHLWNEVHSYSTAVEWVRLLFLYQGVLLMLCLIAQRLVCCRRHASDFHVHGGTTQKWSCLVSVLHAWLVPLILSSELVRYISCAVIGNHSVVYRYSTVMWKVYDRKLFTNINISCIFSLKNKVHCQGSIYI